jgi:hypothetical protein
MSARRKRSPAKARRSERLAQLRAQRDIAAQARGLFDDQAVCYCGHVADEHRATRFGPGSCAVDDCACVSYECDPEATAGTA